MTLADDMDLFSRVPLFGDFPAEQLRLLAFGSKRRYLRPGEELYREGDVSEGGYVIAHGQIDLLITRGSRQYVMGTYLENGLIGEMSLVTDNRRIATAIARNHAEVLFIPREVFRRMLVEYPDLAEILHRKIAASVRTLLAEMGRIQERLERNPGFSQAPELNRLADVKPGNDRDVV